MRKYRWLVMGMALALSACGDDSLSSDGPFAGGGNDSVVADGSSEPLLCGSPDSEDVGLDAEEERFLELLNQHRANNGRAPVVACRALNRAAQAHSEDMRDQDYFDHDGLDGSSPSSRACDACFESCQRVGVGENIAAGNSDAERTFDQWVNSPGHNNNMLRENYAVVGLGRATGGGQYRSYWTNVFATSTDPSCN